VLQECDGVSRKWGKSMRGQDKDGEECRGSAGSGAGVLVGQKKMG